MLNNALTLPHLLLIAVVVLVLFGKGKVSALMGEVGRGVTAFKRGVEDENAAAAARPAPAVEDRTAQDAPVPQPQAADKTLT
ncbi:twin-arginine translocase TatA/TatE family subunit [Paenirhodobacter populi]|uniref:twin-arginine translocase TatA/TatE family subunit n=1 Tax=Paenirhodobacter populi TaxID=2306993 RepID=UPI000FE38E48|nr:twin-arginine translocase TatA/TatE family subunit [Sinirhodobacter populi]RWR08995.1 Sec-independent protein translocase TatA [Sinirhodobacter populi]